MNRHRTFFIALLCWSTLAAFAAPSAEPGITPPPVLAADVATVKKSLERTVKAWEDMVKGAPKLKRPLDAARLLENFADQLTQARRQLALAREAWDRLYAGGRQPKELEPLRARLDKALDDYQSKARPALEKFADDPGVKKALTRLETLLPPEKDPAASTPTASLSAGTGTR